MFVCIFFLVIIIYVLKNCAFQLKTTTTKTETTTIKESQINLLVAIKKFLILFDKIEPSETITWSIVGVKNFNAKVKLSVVRTHWPHPSHLMDESERSFYVSFSHFDLISWFMRWKSFASLLTRPHQCLLSHNFHLYLWIYSRRSSSLIFWKTENVSSLGEKIFVISTCLQPIWFRHHSLIWVITSAVESHDFDLMGDFLLLVMSCFTEASLLRLLKNVKILMAAKDRYSIRQFSASYDFPSRRRYLGVRVQCRFDYLFVWLLRVTVITMAFILFILVAIVFLAM